MKKNIIKAWFVIHLALCILLIYFTATDGISGKHTMSLLVPMSISTLFICLYRMGIFEKGALRPDAEAIQP